MLNLNQGGIATLAVGIAVVAVVGGTVGSSTIIDQIDTQPDSPIYALERAGEKIKEPLFGGQNWEINRGEERTNEFVHMLRKNKVQGYTSLLEEAGNHFSNAAKKASDNQGLKRARNALKKHVDVLENLTDKVPQEAKAAILLARERSSRHMQVLENLGENIPPGRKNFEKMKRELENRMDEANKKIEKKQEKVEDMIENAKGNKKKIENIIEELEKGVRKDSGRNENKGKEISTTGILKKGPEVSETHILLDIDSQEIMYALKSEAIDLSEYINDKVRIEGRVIQSGIDTESIYVNVSDVSIIEDGDENKQNQGESGTPFFEIGNNSDNSWKQRNN